MPDCILITLSFLHAQTEAVVAARTDQNYDVVVYFNNQPLRANGAITLPAFTQTSSIIFSNGQRIPANSRGVVNLRIEVLRSGGGGGVVGNSGYNQGYGNNGGYGSTTGGYYGSNNGQYGGGQYGQYGQYGTQGYGNNGGGYGGYGGGYTTPYSNNRYSSTSGFFDFFNRLGK